MHRKIVVFAIAIVWHWQAYASEATASITTNDLLRHILVLASDEFEGRGPGTAGEERTVDYLLKQFKTFGLQPGNPDGTYFQKVPLVGITGQPTATLSARGKPLEIFLPRDCVIWSRRLAPTVTVKDTDVVFVGYGVVAPEYQWDDFRDVDVRGKTVLMLVNDPPIPDPNDPAKLDEKMFRGRGMTYYGRWTYKFEIASKKGAAAAIIVHETGPAGYPWAVVVGSNTRENMDLQSAGNNAERVAIEGWVTADTATKLCAAAGEDYQALKQRALRRDFRPVPLDVKATWSVTNKWREISSRNVMGKLEGSDLKLKDELVIYTAHWDHLGRNPNLQGDQIYNGAVDNASGTAALLELAEAFSKTRPKRSVLFLSVTAEEKGLLGAKYYATHPLYALERTIANINIDGVNVWGRTRDLGLVGVGQSSLEDLLRTFVEAAGRKLLPEAEPEKGYYFRSDHFEFAKVGVPALYTDEGIDYIGKPADFGKNKRAEYIANDYHKVSDEIKPGWDLSGAVDDIRLLFQVGDALAQGQERPQWKQTSEFKGVRARRQSR
ncbi:MAG TPA: M28 family metallopeptidase [Verrucomicrobiae bacterium]|nr:M28 family metallopeptidase [Verrucomicrobiae bacterium]